MQVEIYQEKRLLSGGFVIWFDSASNYPQLDSEEGAQYPHCNLCLDTQKRL